MDPFYKVALYFVSRAQSTVIVILFSWFEYQKCKRIVSRIKSYVCQVICNRPLCIYAKAVLQRCVFPYKKIMLISIPKNLHWLWIYKIKHLTWSMEFIHCIFTHANVFSLTRGKSSSFNWNGVVIPSSNQFYL